MKKMRNILSIIILSFAFASCEKEIMDYEGQDAIYFDVQYGADWGNEDFWIHQYYSELALAKLDGKEHTFSLKINVAGDIKDYDRYFGIEIVQDSTTAIRGEEFEFDEKLVVKAGEKLTRFEFTVKNSERMNTDTLQIQFRLLPSEDFTLPFSEVGRIPGRWAGDPELAFNQNYDPTVHTVYIHNSPAKPKAWNDFNLGIFTVKKYNLIFELLPDLPKADLEDTDKMQTVLMTMIRRVLGGYLMEQYNKGYEHWVIDEDGTMMYVRQYVTWGAGTRPEDMVKN